MINPNDVNLIIFDMDGTIIPPLPAVYESIKRAFSKLGWQVPFRPEEINQFFGVSPASAKGSLYEFITPPDSHLSIPEIREKVRAEYEATFRDMAQAYPGVKETLAALRKRGYKLAQYTNASTMYLNIEVHRGRIGILRQLVAPLSQGCQRFLYSRVGLRHIAECCFILCSYLFSDFRN